MKPNRSTRNALVRMRAAFLDLQSGQRYTEANDLLDLIERIEPPSATDGEAPGSGARLAARAGRSESATLSPVSSAPATYSGRVTALAACDNCGMTLVSHCTTHLLPCCPGSLMHGQDEGTWTPSAEPTL